MFVDPESLPEMQSPRRYGKYLVRKFDGNMSETKVEHARILNEVQDRKKFSFRDAIFLSTNTTPRLSRMPSNRSTLSTPRDVIEQVKQLESESKGIIPTISGLDKLSDSKLEPHCLDYELLSIRSEGKETDSLKQESVDSTMLSTQNDQVNRTNSFLQIPQFIDGGVSPRVGKTSLFRSSMKLPPSPHPPKAVKEMNSPTNYPQIRLSSLFLNDVQKIVSYSPAFSRTHSKISDSDKSCMSKVSQGSQFPSIKLQKIRVESHPLKHKKRMKKLFKIAKLCNLNINVVKEEILRYQGEKNSIKLASYLEREIRKRANLFSSEVRVQMHNLDKLKREWQKEEQGDESESDVSGASTFSSTSFDSDASSISSKSRLFTL